MDHLTSIPRELVRTLVVAVIVAMFVRTFLFQAFQIPSASMQDSLLVGDHLVVNRFVFGPVANPAERWIAPMREIRRHDVVVFKFPEEPARDLVKRVAGLPGETIEIRGGRLLVDGRSIEERFVTGIAVPVDASDSGGHAAPGAPADYGPVVVPPGHLFVLGDNRGDSDDSRSWGFLPAHLVKGRAMVVYWSFAPRLGRPAGAARWGFGDTRWKRILTPVR